MATPRFYTESSLTEISPGQECALSEAEARHAGSVLRLKAGDEAELFDGRGRVVQGSLTEVGKRSATLSVTHAGRIPELTPCITIAFAPPKGKRCLATVEALTELGADRLQPLNTARGVAEGGNLAKWRQRVIEASKQCHRAWIPEILPACAIDSLPLDEDEALCIASLTPEALTPNGLIAKLEGRQRVTWVIGPEGGFTEEEEEALLTRGAFGVRLAPHILRIGTAAELACGLTRFLLAP
ncbi:MAG: RsmE family RNA methyltransferase [Planctomycetota bacterium]|jgi:16S rRNA (uracil1498-N3)-methyltransferase